MTLKKILAVGAAVVASVAIAPAHAAEFPSKPLTVVVGFGAGGGTDEPTRRADGVRRAARVLGERRRRREL